MTPWWAGWTPVSQGDCNRDLTLPPPAYTYYHQQSVQASLLRAQKSWVLVQEREVACCPSLRTEEGAGQPLAERQWESFLPGLAWAAVGGLQGKSLLPYGSISALLFPQSAAQVMGVVSSTISVGFFALSGISAQLLNALGLDGEWQTAS